MADHFIVMNPYARHVRSDKILRSRVAALMGKQSAVIETQTVHDMLAALTQLAEVRPLTNVAVYVVGGDGTFNQVLNWALEQPLEKRPKLLPVGGGQFNFMCKYVGLRSTDPAVNLAAIDSGRMKLGVKKWRPVCVTDSLSGQRRYGAVVGNGGLCDFVEMYEETGKGDLLAVVKLTLAVIQDFAKNAAMGKHGRLKPIKGEITIDGTRLPCGEYINFMAATVPEFMPTCHPFRASPGPETFPMFVYWGSLARLAVSVPQVWQGKTSPLTDAFTFNAAAKQVVITTTDARILVDGDLHTWPEPTQNRILTVSYGPEIQLLHAV